MSLTEAHQKTIEQGSQTYAALACSLKGGSHFAIIDCILNGLLHSSCVGGVGGHRDVELHGLLSSGQQPSARGRRHANAY